MSTASAAAQPEKSDSLRRGARFLARLLAPKRPALILVSALGLVSAMANGLVPYVIGRFFDALVGVKGADTFEAVMPVVWLLVAWLAMQCIANAVDWINDRWRKRVDTQVRLDVRSLGFSHLLRLPIAYHRTERMIEALEKFGKASWMCATVVQTLASLAPQILSIVVGLAVSFYINAWLALILLGGVSVYIVIMLRVVRRAEGALDRSVRSWNEGWGRVGSVAIQAEAVKQATAEDYEEKRNAENARQTFEVSFKTERMWTNLSAFQRFVVMLTQLGVFSLSVYLLARGRLTPGELVALNGYALMFFGPFVQLGHSWQLIQNGLAAGAEAERVLAHPAERYRPADAVPIAPGSSTVEFKSVGFHYTEADGPVLVDVSFVAKPGMSVALVGESGVGKSTFISLLSAYYFPTAGAVTVNGVDTRQADLRDLRGRIAVVPQEVALFNDTIEANIRYGAFDASHDDVVRAAQEAHIAGVIDKLPQGYQTIVGERGVRLSVGQKQRVAIARAILRNPQILVLDEPTSALDPHTERLITESLERLMRGRTTFIVAHRLSTIRAADLILVIENGRVVERGNHEKLLALNGAYRRLHDYHVGLRA